MQAVDWEIRKNKSHERFIILFDSTGKNEEYNKVVLSSEFV